MDSSTERQRLVQSTFFSHETRIGLQTSERMHGHQHSNLGFAHVEQELEFRIIFIEPCDRSSSLFTSSLCGIAAPFYRSLLLSNVLSAKVVERPSSVISPRRSGISVSLTMTVITYVSTVQPLIPLGLLWKVAFLASYLCHGMPGKANKVIPTHITAVCAQISPSKFHHEVFVNGGSTSWKRSTTRPSAITSDYQWAISLVSWKTIRSRCVTICKTANIGSVISVREVWFWRTCGWLKTVGSTYAHKHTRTHTHRHTHMHTLSPFMNYKLGNNMSSNITSY